MVGSGWWLWWLVLHVHLLGDLVLHAPAVVATGRIASVDLARRTAGEEDNSPQLLVEEEVVEAPTARSKQVRSEPGECESEGGVEERSAHMLPSSLKGSESVSGM
jgi:hypothetical protein